MAGKAGKKDDDLGARVLGALRARGAEWSTVKGLAGSLGGAVEDVRLQVMLMWNAGRVERAGGYRFRLLP
jgi:hypothetical protein